MLLHVLFFLSNSAQAVPVQFNQQGRLTDVNGAPVDGSHVLTIQLFDGPLNSNFIWGENLTVTFVNGYYNILLGTDANNVLDSDILDQNVLYMEIQVDSDPPLQPRQKLSSVPYAKRSDVATNLEGGTIDATEISINGNIVLDSSGHFTGQPVTPQWSDIQNIPNGFADGIDDDSDTLADISCASDDMVLYYTGGTWNCAFDDVLDSADVIGFVESESDLLVNLSGNSTVDGESIQTGADQDTLGNLNCTGGQVVVFDPTTSVWSCGEDSDTKLTESEVISMVQASTSLTLALSSSSSVDGESILTSSSELDWNNIVNTPSGLEDGDDNSDSLAALNCSVGQVAIRGEAGWECKEFTSLLDNDEDGVLQWNDCDDNNPDLPSTDADCDGVLTADDCNDDDPSVSSGTGSTLECAATSCLSILSDGFSVGSGLYYIDPDGSGAFQTLCDMETDGGGWTLTNTLVDDDRQLADWDSNNMWNYPGVNRWEDQSTFGSLDTATTARTGDYKNPAYWSLSSSNLMVVHSPNGTNIEETLNEAIYVYHTTNNFLQNYGGNLYFLYSDHYNLSGGSNCTQGLKVDVTYTVGSASSLDSHQGINNRNESDPGGITFRAVNNEGHAQAFCPVKYNGCNSEHACAGGEGTTGGRGRGGWGNLNEWIYDSNWYMDSTMRTSTMMFFLR